MTGNAINLQPNGSSESDDNAGSLLGVSRSFQSVRERQDSIGLAQNMRLSEVLVAIRCKCSSNLSFRKTSMTP